MTNQPSSIDKVQAAADTLRTAAQIALTDYADDSRGDGFSRRVAVQHLATNGAREATARMAAAAGSDFNGPAELMYAHMLIAELAARLAEQDQR